MKKHIVGVLPARGGSKGIPKKNLIDLCGKPLIVWTIEHALGSSSIADFYVSTENEEIADVSRRSGAKVIRRPDELAGDTATSESALLHALNVIEAQGPSVDLVVFYQATSPLRKADDTDLAVEEFHRDQADSLFSGTRLDDATFWMQRDGVCESVTYDYKNRGRRQDRAPVILENGSIYIFRPSVLRTLENRIGGNMAIYLMPLWQSTQIDSLEELDLCQYWMKRHLLPEVSRQNR